MSKAISLFIWSFLFFGVAALGAELQPSRTLDDQGRLASERTFKNGKEEGASHWYYPDGRLKAEIHFHDGIPDGPAIWYGPDGKMRSSGNFSQGRFTSSSAQRVAVAPPASTESSFPWAILVFLSLLSILPLPMLFRRWGIAGYDSLLQRLARSPLFLVAGILLIVAGIAGLLWTSGHDLNASRVLFAACFLVLTWGTGLSTLAVLAREEGLIEPREKWMPRGGSPSPAAVEAGGRGARPRLELITRETLVVAAPRVMGKYWLELSLQFALALGVAAVGPLVCRWISPDSSGNAATFVRSLLLWGTPTLGILLGWVGVRVVWRERALCRRCQGRELLLGPEGFRVAIGLVEGETRGRMRKASLETLLVPWEHVQEFFVEPSKFYSLASPASYRIRLAPEGRYLVIRRRQLYGREELILRAAQGFLECPILLNDKLH